MSITRDQLPPHWELVTMGDVADVIGGSTPKSKEPAYWGGSIPWLSVSDLTGYTDRYISGGARTITELGYESCSTQMLPAGTVVFSSRAPIGYVAIASRPLCTSQGFKSFVLRGDISPEYVYWYLRYAKHIAEAMASGTTFKELSGKSAAALPIPLPPRAEQDRIAERLDALLGDVSSGRLRLQDAQSALGSYCAAVNEQELGVTSFDHAIARGWRVLRPDEVVRRVPNALAIGPFGSNLKVSDYRTAGVPLVFVRNIREKRFTGADTRYVDGRKAEELAGHRVTSGDVLITKMGDPPGDAAVYPAGAADAIITADCIRFAVDETLLSPEFAALLFRTSFIKRQVLERVKGVAQQKISLKTFRELQLQIPSRREQEDILDAVAGQLQNAARLSDILARALAGADALRHSLLHHAFTGQLAAPHSGDGSVEDLLGAIRSQRNGRQTNKRRALPSRSYS